MPRLCEFNPGICLTTEEKHGKTCQGSQGMLLPTISTLTLLRKPHTSIQYKTQSQFDLCYRW